MEPATRFRKIVKTGHVGHCRTRHVANVPFSCVSLSAPVRARALVADDDESLSQARSALTLKFARGRSQMFVLEEIANTSTEKALI
jgi:hypothetical protein